MRGWRRSLGVLGVLAGVAAVHVETRADDARVVAHIGPRTVTEGEVAARIAALAPVQRASFGRTVAEVRRRVLDEVIVRDALLGVAADDQQLALEQPAAYQIERALSGATVRAVRERVGPASSIPDGDVQRYFDENRARYEAPERYQIWRILCKTREDAQSVLDAAKHDPSPTSFETLARDHSLDKASNLRGGNLGFLTAEGTSAEPGLRVDPAVVRAAQAVADGQLVGAPVAEGEYFSVVWRRGTIAAIHRSVGDVAPQIRDAIWKRRIKEETDKLVAALRGARVRDLDGSVLSIVDLPADPAGPPVGAAPPPPRPVSAPSGSPK